MSRINYLDGHRGIAILLVIAYHAFSRWPDLVPYGNDFSDIPVFKFGYLGVQLFFLISGFVIFMSLDKSSNISSFIYRRWLRLFPAMLACSLIIFLTAGFFYERPNGQPELKDLIAGLSFVDPYIWLKLTGLQISSIEGAFWSLYVEFKFYIVASLLYFILGRKRLVLAIFLCFLMWLSSRYLVEVLSLKQASLIYTLTATLSFEYFGWFAAGAAYYSYLKSGQTKWFVFGLLISVISALVEGKSQLAPSIAALLISIFFATSIVSTRLQLAISNKAFLYFGVISYPLYLLHENMMISMTIKMGDHLDFVPSFTYPILSIGLISLLSYYIAKVVEPSVKTALIRGFSVLNRILPDRNINKES